VTGIYYYARFRSARISTTRRWHLSPADFVAFHRFTCTLCLRLAIRWPSSVWRSDRFCSASAHSASSGFPLTGRVLRTVGVCEILKRRRPFSSRSRHSGALEEFLSQNISDFLPDFDLGLSKFSITASMRLMVRSTMACHPAGLADWRALESIELIFASSRSTA
jgi:hypothetical protein